MAGARHYLSLIKFAHSIFALPFALIAFLVASDRQGDDGGVDLRVLGLVVLCMVCARAAAMAYNRYVDRDVDAANPRTAGREIPAGVIAPGSALLFTALASAAFLAAAAAIHLVCFYMGIPVLLVLLGYSHAKRLTVLCHLWLGVSLGLAPLAAWVAVRGTLDGSLLYPAALAAGVAVWVMGFDVLYACQDEDFDRRHELKSIPARFGRKTALRLSRLAHALSVPLFAGFGFVTDAGVAYYSGVFVVAVTLFVEHRVISETDMSRVNMAFFTMNGVVSLVMLLGTVLDLYVF